LFYYTDFAAHKVKQKTGKGGGSATSYTYSATILMGLCEGQIEGIGQAWVDLSVTTSTDFSTLNLTLFDGSPTQTAWSYLVSKHPTEALDYRSFAYLAGANYDLGSSANTPQHSFEVRGIHYNTAPVTSDADCALVVNSYLTADSWGVGFDTSAIDYDQLYSSADAPTTGDSAYQTYCTAMGFGLSPAITSQEQASSALQRWADLTNTALYWNGYQLKLIPYGDADITANGVTWIAPVDVVFTITDDDYIQVSDGNPIKMSRTDPLTLNSSYSLTIKNRANAYNDLPVPWVDQDLAEKYGLRIASAISAPEVCDATMASVMIALYGQRQSYIRNEYKFSLDQRYVRLEPMDVGLMYDKTWGLVPVRVESVEEDDTGNLQMVVMEYPQGTSSSTGFGTQPVTNTPQNQLADPGPVNPPVIFEPPTTLTTNGAYQLWMAVSGGDGTTAGTNWGGCNVWISTDDATYVQVGTISGGPATMGVLSANVGSFGGSNPDTTNTVKVDLTMSSGIMTSFSSTDAALAASLCYVGGELLSYENATLTALSAYTLDTLYRALYGTSATTHSTGDQFALLDASVFKYDLPPQYVGVEIYIKFQSFNLWGQAPQDLSVCTAYTYTPTGGGVPVSPTSLTANGGAGQNFLNWTASVSPDVSEYDIYAYHGTSTMFSDGTLLGTTNSNSFIHSGLPSADTWTYWVTSKSLGGESTTSPAGPVYATTS